jgi:hypothetical protein
MSSSSSSSVAAPAVVDKHAALLKMVNKCNHYKCTFHKARQPKEKKEDFSHFFLVAVVRSFCMHCFMALIDASPNTVNCRLGVLCGCGARYCGIKCLVAAAQEHKVVCEMIQPVLQFFSESRFRANEKTNQLAFKWCGDFVQIDLLRADMLLATQDVVDALVGAAESVRIAEAFELAQKLAQRALSVSATGSLSEAMALPRSATSHRTCPSMTRRWRISRLL